MKTRPLPGVRDAGAGGACRQRASQQQPDMMMATKTVTNFNIHTLAPRLFYRYPQSNLAPLPLVTVEQLRAAYPGIPDDFLQFLRQIGHGTIGQSEFSIYPCPIKPNTVFDQETAQTLAGILLIANNAHRFYLAYDPSSNWAFGGVDQYGRFQPISGINSFTQFVEVSLLTPMTEAEPFSGRPVRGSIMAIAFLFVLAQIAIAWFLTDAHPNPDLRLAKFYDKLSLFLGFTLPIMIVYRWRRLGVILGTLVVWVIGIAIGDILRGLDPARRNLGDALWFLLGWVPCLLYCLLLYAHIAGTVGELQNHHKPGICPACGLDLSATPDHCPRCGTPVPEGHVVKVNR